MLPTVSLPADEANICGNAARIGVSPDMVLNADGFAECMTTHGQPVLDVVATPISITFEYRSGVVGQAGPAYSNIYTYCQGNSFHVGGLLGAVYNYNCGSWAYPNTAYWANCGIKWCGG